MKPNHAGGCLSPTRRNHLQTLIRLLLKNGSVVTTMVVRSLKTLLQNLNGSFLTTKWLVWSLNWFSCVLSCVTQNSDAAIYKVNYDDKNWLLLIRTLKHDVSKIPTLNRVQLIADAADLSYVGILDYDLLFNLLSYLKHETEYLPWKTALGKADTLKNHLINNSIYGYFKVVCT